MAKNQNKNEKIRLNLAIPISVRDRLERLQALSEAESLTEVIRRALAVYDFLLSHSKAQQSEVFVRFEDGKEEKLTILT